jgi:hypothetical protein
MMFEWANLHVLALVGVALQFGGMAYFAFMFTPMVFKFVDSEDASLFLRQVFPVYHRSNAVISILPALLLIPGQSYGIEIGTMLAVAAVFLFAARVLVPMANSAREEKNDAKFKIVHRVSVTIHMIQFVAVSVILIRLAQ